MDFKSFNIIVIEDDQDTRTRILADLNELGFQGEISQAVDGVQALEVLAKLEKEGKHLDMGICDIVMPNKTGIEFLKELRAGSSKFKMLPILMLSSHSDRQLIVSCIKLGIGQYLIKPWDKKSLMLKIMEVFKKEA